MRADSNPIWFSDKIDTAINVLETILKHYTVVRDKASKYGLAPDSFLPSAAAFATMQRLVLESRPNAAMSINKAFASAGFPVAGFKEPGMARRLSNWERVFAAVSGAGFLLIILAIVILVPKPTEFQEFTFRLVLALAAGAFAGLIAGFINIEKKGPKSALRAGGGLAVFVIVYFVNPPKIISDARTGVSQSTSRSSSQSDTLRGG